MKNVLEKIPFFRTLSDDELEYVAQLLGPKPYRLYPTGTELLHEGETGKFQALYIIVSGRVGVYKGAEKETLLAELGENQTFGEMSLFGEYPYAASVRTLEPSQIAKMTIALVFDLLINRPKTGIKILEPLLTQYSERIWALNARVIELEDEMARLQQFE